MNFLYRFRWPLFLGIFGITVATLASTYLEPFKEGFNPYATIMKAFAKFIYVMFAIMLMHFVIKYWFPTIYGYSCSGADRRTSVFARHWRKLSESDKVKITVFAHVGVWIGVCLLLALAF